MPSHPEAFTHTFLLQGGDSSRVLKVIGPNEADLRKKKAHRKSRNGCYACKRRKVKCDERYPCYNCIKRKDTCSRSTREASPLGDDYVPIIRNLDPMPNADARANLLHLELFHHFENVTIDTLSFEGVWRNLIPLSFREEHLMTAMLATSARHLNYLCPHDARYSQAAMLLLSRSCANFRSVLGGEITSRNCDAVLATAILIHYLTWCDLSFLDGQDLDDLEHNPLDLMQDKLFLLSAGVRQIFFILRSMIEAEGSAFVTLTKHSPCCVVEKLIDDTASDWQSVSKQLMQLYDDPSVLQGRTRALESADGTSSATSTSSTSTPAEIPIIHDVELPTQKEQEAEHDETVDAFSLARLAPKPSDVIIQVQEADIARSSYKQIVDRLAVILTFLTEFNGRSEQYYQASSKTPFVSLMHPTRSDIERYFLSFPLLCFGPFLTMVQAGDLRALIVLYHIYRTGRLLLGTQGSWWAARRSVVMEAVLRKQLKAKGLDGCLRHSLGKDATRGGSAGCPMDQAISGGNGFPTDHARNEINLLHLVQEFG